MPPQSTSNTTAKGTMSSINSAISSKKHNIIFSDEALNSVARIALKQTKLEKTEAGQSAKKAKRIAEASGIPLHLAEEAAKKTALELANLNSIKEVQDILMATGTLTTQIHTNVMDEMSIATLFKEIDKFAENHNLGQISRMSTSKLKELLSQNAENKDLCVVISHAIKLKEHQKSLKSLRLAKLKYRNSVFQMARNSVKDVDSLNMGMTFYDTARSVKRTAKTIKHISKTIQHRNVAKAATNAAKTSAQTSAQTSAKTTAKTTAKTATQTSAKATTQTAAKAAAKTTTKATGRAASKVATKTTFKSVLVKGAPKLKVVFVPKSPLGWIIAGVVLLILIFSMLILTIVSSINNTNTGFLTTENGEDATSPYDSQAGIMYIEIQERDALWIDELNNFSTTHTPQEDLDTTPYGYWDPNSQSQYIIPKWDKSNVVWLNGDGEELGLASNSKEIISAGAVFIDNDFDGLKKTFKLYTRQLWKDTHTYKVFPSEVYACSNGCGGSYSYSCKDRTACENISKAKIVGGYAASYSSNGCRQCERYYCGGCTYWFCSGSCVLYNESDTEENEAEQTTPRECPGHFDCFGHACRYSSSSVCYGHCSGHTVQYCIGHMDAEVEATVNGIEEERNDLFDVDTLGAITGNNLKITPELTKERYNWSGWDKDTIGQAIEIATDDWYDLYGIGEATDSDFSYASVSEDVDAYDFYIRQYAIEYGIAEYVDLIKAVMMQESGGRGNDPMQASECSYNTEYPRVPNGITVPEYSIKVGIQYFADCLNLAKVEGPSDMDHIKLALQGYNYGTGYITWAQANYGGYTISNAAEFSDMMAQQSGWSSYGDKQYVPHVLRYYTNCKGNQDIASTALSQVGNVGGRPYWSWYGFDSRVAWCACFVSWCADQNGYIDDGTILKFAYCPTGANWFKEKGLWKSRKYEPVAGDIIFFDWEGDGVTDHVGIVTKTANSIVYTVEGNSSDQCKQKQYPIGSNCIFGYGTPSY